MAKVVRPPAAPASANRPAAVSRPTVAVRKPTPAPSGPGRFGQLSNLGSQSLQKTPVASFFRESFSELRKVHWPNREQATQMTVIVILFSLATGIVLGGLDFVFAQLIAFLVGAH